MNRVSIIVILLLMGQVSQVNAQREKEFQIRAGFGWSIYDADFKLRRGGRTVENEDGGCFINAPWGVAYGL